MENEDEESSSSIQKKSSTIVENRKYNQENKLKNENSIYYINNNCIEHSDNENESQNSLNIKVYIENENDKSEDPIRKNHQKKCSFIELASTILKNVLLILTITSALQQSKDSGFLVLFISTITVIFTSIFHQVCLVTCSLTFIRDIFTFEDSNYNTFHIYVVIFIILVFCKIICLCLFYFKITKFLKNVPKELTISCLFVTGLTHILNEAKVNSLFEFLINSIFGILFL